MGDTQTWRYLGGMLADPLLTNNPSAAFRLVAYQASGGPLEFDNVEVGSVMPEPAGATLAILAVIFLGFLSGRTKRSCEPPRGCI